MKNVDTADPTALNDRAQCTNDGFHFREFRHERGIGSSSRLKSERVLPSLRFSGITKRSENGFAFIPVRELIRVMAASRLAGFSCGDEHNGLIPVFRIGDKTHGGAVSLRGCTHAIDGACLRLVCNAQGSLQKTVASEGMKHVQGVKAFPRPIFRSEEHTSELQSRENLVCRLLLEKKNLCDDVLQTVD